MKKAKDPDNPKTPRNGVSRRGFLGRVGVGGGALGSGVLEQEAPAQAPAAGKFSGPGPFPSRSTSTAKRIT